MSPFTFLTFFFNFCFQCFLHLWYYLYSGKEIYRSLSLSEWSTVDKLIAVCLGIVNHPVLMLWGNCVNMYVHMSCTVRIVFLRYHSQLLSLHWPGKRVMASSVTCLEYSLKKNNFYLGLLASTMNISQSALLSYLSASLVWKCWQLCHHWLYQRCPFSAYYSICLSRFS